MSDPKSSNAATSTSSPTTGSPSNAQQQPQQQGSGGSPFGAQPEKVTTWNTRKQNPEPAFVLYPRGTWSGFGSEKDLEKESMPKTERSKNPVTMYFSMRRDYFVKRRQLQHYLNRDSEDGQYLRQALKPDEASPDPWLLRMEADASVQAVRSKVENGTQVPHFRKVDFSVQVQPDIVDACSPPPIKAGFTAAADGSSTAAADGDSSSEAIEDQKQLQQRARSFFDRVMPRMLHHLTQAGEVKLFEDDFQNLVDEDTNIVSNREDSDLIEAGNFSPAYLRDKHVSAIDWKPGGQRIIAVAAIRATPLEQRLEASLDVEPAVSIICNLHEQTNPQMLLESPAEALCIKFHPKPLSTIVIAGLTNGQVCMWDMERAPIDHRRVGGPASQHGKKGHHHGQQGGGGKGHNAAVSMTSDYIDEEALVALPELPVPIRGHTIESASDEHELSRLQPLMVSRVENSHRRAVHDICWLPDGLECGFDGRATVNPDATQQFATISEDGHVFIWDLRPENLPSDRLRKLKHQGRSTGDQESKVWVPLLRYQLPRHEGPGDLVGLRLHIEGRTQMGQGPPSYLFMATTLEGELCCGNWGPKPGSEDQPKSLTGFDASGPSSSANAKIVRYISAAHAGPVWGLHRHPQLPDIFLSVGDWGFKVWRVGVEVPIVSSPMGEQQTTCGRWSTTRAGLVFIGTKDGFVQVWDLLDRSHQPVLKHQVIKDAITSIEFRPLHNPHAKRIDRQTIALGTKVGSIYFFELPRALIRGPNSELKNARQHFERETRRVHYYSWRWEERRKEMERQAVTQSVSTEGDEKTGTSGAAAAASSSAVKVHAPKDDLIGGAQDENAGDFVFTAEDDARYLELVEQLAAEDTRMQRNSTNAAKDADEEP